MSSGSDDRIPLMIFGYFAGLYIVLFVVLALAIPAAVLFTLFYWWKIYNVNGARTVAWLFGITAFLEYLVLSLAFRIDPRTGSSPIEGGELFFIAFFLVAPTIAYLIYRFVVPTSPFRLQAIAAVHYAFEQGQITTKERKHQISVLQKMEEDALEEMFISHNAEQPRELPSEGETITHSDAPPRSHPREAFDIPDR